MDVLEPFYKLKVWKKKNERAPHKPLLVLYAIAQLVEGKDEISFEKAESELRDLIETFGPPRKGTPENPFTRLVNDGVWEVRGSKSLDTYRSYSANQLRKLSVIGRFRSEVVKALSAPEHRLKIIEYLLNDNFPPSLHDDILTAIGLDLGKEVQIVTKKPRDPKFRKEVLKAYEYRCAVCQFQVRKGNVPVGLEAAHIMWHESGGPDHITNGVALCSLHHKLFDYGLFCISPDLIFHVSTEANGSSGFNDWLMNFHNKGIQRPLNEKLYPKRQFIEWQVNQVFKGKPRP